MSTDHEMRRLGVSRAVGLIERSIQDRYRQGWTIEALGKWFGPSFTPEVVDSIIRDDDREEVQH